ncbi:Annexin [Ancylostoma caninum]|uniref:Annexin n=1 Tax=Ancylostoma caninum TaxID=29170 RepID=A0A368GTI2_ANCCA|nr:Annexin [Ancylostoma caninum]
MNSPYATIVDNQDFHPALYAEKIDRALRAGDKDTIVKVLTSISNNQRQQLREPYKIKYGKDIIAALDKKFSGDLERTIFALMDTPLDYDVKQLKQAMKGLGTDEAVLIEILCSRTPDQMAAIRIAYEREYKTPLEKDVGSTFHSVREKMKALKTLDMVASDTSGEFKDLLVALVTGSRDGSRNTNDQEAKDDAVRLYADGKAKLVGKDSPSHFLKILATQNQYQLRKVSVSHCMVNHREVNVGVKVFAAFADLSGSTIEKAIEKEFSGDLQKSYLTIVQAASDKQKFFARQLYNSMKVGLGTRDNDLIRVLVTRSEVDLELIKQEFQALYNKPLEDMIKGDTSGQYRDALLAIVVGNRM